MNVCLGVFIQWVLICMVTCLLVLISWHVFKISNYWKIRGVPYKRPVFLLGNLEFIMRKSAWEFFNELKIKYPAKCVGIFLGWKPALVVQTPALARQLLVKDAAVFQDRFIYSDSSDPLGSLNLFTVKNPIWTEMRHELSPMFTSSRLRKITELMNLNAQQLVQKVKRDYLDKKQPVNLKELFSMYTSDTIGYSVFGLRVSSLSGNDSPLWAITSHMVKWTFWRGLEFTVIFLMPFIAKFFRLKLFSPPATEYVKKLFWNVVRDRESSRTSTDKDLVNHLLKLKENLKLPAEAGSELADNLMMAQAAVFILGSVETSSATLSYCLHELAHHQDIQEKLYKEVNDAFKQTGKEVLEYDDLKEMKYLSSCIYETLRKHTPVPYLDRICSKPYDLDGIKVEPGTPVFINLIALHHDETLYPEPERWNPERTIATTDNDNLNYNFLPFGEGPRFCIGKRYGLMQIRAALSQLVHKYRMEPGPRPYKVQPDPYSVVLSPKDGGSVKFVQR